MRTLQLMAFAATLGASFLTPGAAGQTRFATLYTFKGQPDGYMPNGVTGGDGALYGTTALGGASGNGTVFELQPPAAPDGAWTETPLYSFTCQNGDGCGGTAVPAAGAGGVLYGTTAGGGAASSGTVFRLQPPASLGGAWTEQVLYSFTGQNALTGDGWDPNTKLVIGSGGTLYGTTLLGGAHNYGTVFALEPPAATGEAWTETLLYSFPDKDSAPQGLALSDTGLLYGTTMAGGNSRAGTVYQLSPPASPGGAWTHTTLYSFAGGADGCGPSGPPVISSDGSLYGATFGTFVFGEVQAHGDGTVFQLAPPTVPGGIWTKTILHRMGKGNGWGPDSPLIVRDGAIYGTAADLNGGMVYRLQKPVTPGDPWTLTTLHRFGYYIVPGGGLAMDKSGAIFGTTSTLTILPIPGTVYRVTP